MSKLLRVKHVVVHCRGGLGNQLFQASAGYLVAKELDSSLYIDLSLAAVHDSENPVDISSLRVLEKYTTPVNIRNKLCRNLIINLFSRVWHRPKLNWIFPSYDLNSIGTFSLGSFDHVFRTFSTIHLYGYFADFSYEVKSNLFASDLNPTKPSKWFQEMAITISKEPVIAVHVRRGDFLTSPEHYGILGSEYYQRAIAAIPSEWDRAQIWVFSDSPLLAQETLSSLQDFRFKYVFPPIDSNALESLILMSMAEGHIVANSTYSFWSAYLSKNSRFVCYPARDRHGQVIVQGLPNEWIQIEESWI